MSTALDRSYVRPMSTTHDYRPPSTDGRTDTDRALATLTAAFCADPVIRWLFPDTHTFLVSFPELARLMGGDALPAATAAIANDFAGVALWLSPDTPEHDAELGALLEATTDPSRHDVVFDMLGQVMENHPTDPVWYLPFVGVDPTRQGRGIGAELVRAGLARADADSLPAYLEASTPRNRALYERLGFEVLGEIQAADSPPLWPMLRPVGGAR